MQTTRLLLALALGLAACDEGDEGGEGDAADTAWTGASEGGESGAGTSDPYASSAFAREILPIFAASCSCHDAELGAPLGLVLTGSATTIAEVHAGLIDQPSGLAELPLVAPGAPEQSFLLEKIHGDLTDVVCNPRCGDPMPPSGTPVSEADQALLTRWIEDGATLE